MKKKKFHFQLLTWWLNFYFSSFELLTRTWKVIDPRLILEIQFYPCHVPFEGHQKKASLFFDHPLIKFIFTSQYNQLLFSAFVFLVESISY